MTAELKRQRNLLGIDSVQGAVAVTPHDTNELDFVTRGIYVGVSGDLKVQLFDGTIITYVDILAGVTHAKAVRQVFDTGTTATNIIAEY